VSKVCEGRKLGWPPSSWDSALAPSFQLLWSHELFREKERLRGVFASLMLEWIWKESLVLLLKMMLLFECGCDDRIISMKSLDR